MPIQYIFFYLILHFMLTNNFININLKNIYEVILINI